MKTRFAILVLPLLSGPAAAQTLIVPVNDTREVTATAIEGPFFNPTQQDTSTETASGFGAFEESVEVHLTSSSGFVSAFASMDSEILDHSISAIGSAHGNGSGTGVFCGSSLSHGAVTFDVAVPCSYRFRGFVEGYDDGIGEAYFETASGDWVAGVFGFATGVTPVDSSGTIQPGRYQFQVRCSGGFCGTYGASNFDIVLDLTPLIENYCVSTPNSSGAAATVGSIGSQSIAANDFVLTLTSAPPGQFGLLLYGEVQAAEPLWNGTLCLASPFIRLGSPALIGSAGSLDRALDFTTPPLSTGAGAIHAGSTWNFQWVFRDSVGAGIDFSDGLAVSFAP